jgi:hypothetical protein
MAINKKGLAMTSALAVIAASVAGLLESLLPSIKDLLGDHPVAQAVVVALTVMIAGAIKSWMASNQPPPPPPPDDLK